MSGKITFPEMKPENIQSILLSECSSFDKKGFDSDIDLYVNLIADKKYRSAASVYQQRLVPRYPDEVTRIKIIRYYRKKDPRFSQVYTGAVKDLLERIIYSVKKLIDYITVLFEDNTSNPYELLKNIEKALHIIPAGKEAGISFLNRMDVYSVLLDYKVEKFTTSSDILKRYFDNTLFVKVEIPKKEKIKKEEPVPAKESGREKVTIDLDAVTFTAEEIKSICIDSFIKERAYQVLAYCRLYWKNIFNQDFEKKVFLYSRKFSTLHYKIFLTIRNGRVRRIGDDVILLELYSLLSSRYQYSMREDSLMQKLWRRIKPVEEASVSIQSRDGMKSAAAKILPPPESVMPAPAAPAAPAVAAVTDKKEKQDRQGKKISLKPAPISAPAFYNIIISLYEKLEKLCKGELFDAHKEFENLLPKYIERYLEKHKKPGASPAGDPYVQKGAKYLIMNFIKENIKAVPFNWNSSIEKREITNMGYDVAELDTIIATCLEEVRMRRAIVR